MMVSVDTALTPSEPLVSVVVPNLNGGAFLGATLESIASQAVPPLEVIAVDGGSTDNSPELLRSWKTRLPLCLISEPDRGQADAINKGLAFATGDVVTWLNSDDLWQPHALEIVRREFAADPDLDFLWGFCLVIDGQGRPLYVQNPWVRPNLADLHRHRNFVPQPASFFRRSLVERYEPLDIAYDYAFDYEFFLRFAGQVKARFVPEVLASFRIHPGSKTGTVPRRFLAEERSAYRAHGGRALEPFYLDYWRYRLIAAPLDRAKAPLRRVIWRLLGLPVGSRIRA